VLEIVRKELGEYEEQDEKEKERKGILHVEQGLGNLE
jgi:hypothetical protein